MNRLQTLTKKALPKTILFQCPTISALIKTLSEEEEIIDFIKEEETTTTTTGNEEIGIVGMSCRFPGAENIEEFWELLINGRNAIGDIPVERFGERAKEFPIQRGGFIGGVDQFDAEFFGISSFEAKFMDPQQRIVMEETWHAMENGGIRPETLFESKTGIFIGLWNEDYFHILKV